MCGVGAYRGTANAVLLCPAQIGEVAVGFVENVCFELNARFVILAFGSERCEGREVSNIVIRHFGRDHEGAGIARRPGNWGCVCWNVVSPDAGWYVVHR